MESGQPGFEADSGPDPVSLQETPFNWNKLSDSLFLA